MSDSKAERVTHVAEGKTHRIRTLEIAHDLDNLDIARTADIHICEDIDFKGLLLSGPILQGLKKSNFRRPSPIQLRAIPLVRCGFDLIVQAKSGTGKTLVIGVAALEALTLDCKKVQVLVIAPTREIAIQVKEVVAAIGGGISGLMVETFIGGLNIQDDIKRAARCQIAVATPGRLKDLVQNNYLSLQGIRLLVLDEADKLMEEAFIHDVKDVIKKMPNSRQTVLCSATFDEPLSKFIRNYMNTPMWVSPEGTTKLTDGQQGNSKYVSKVLLGVKQFLKELPTHSNAVKQLQLKSNELVRVLSSVPFSQCIVFSNYQSRAESLCNMLSSLDWPAISICGKDDQKQRMEAISSFRNLQFRVLVSTDLTARGIDIPGVNMVVNLDIPNDAATYLHRVGRAGRFGSHGVAITFASGGKEVISLKEIVDKIDGACLYHLPNDLSLISQDNNLDQVCSSSEGRIEVKESEVVSLNEDSRSVSGTQCNQEVENCHTKNLRAKQEEEKAVANREAVAVEEAKSNIAQAVLSMQTCKQDCTFSYEELEEEFQNWLPNTYCNLSMLSPGMIQKRPDWWSSAEIVLAAAEKQLHNLKITKSTVQITSSDVSNDEGKFVNERRKKKIYKHKKPNTQYKNLNGSNNFNTLRCDVGQWEYDPISGDSFCWEPERKLWWKYDHSTEDYFCYNVECKSFYFWDSNSNKFHPIGDQNQNHYQSNPSCNERKPCENGVASSQNCYSDWFSMWMTQLSQVKSYVENVEYWKSVGKWK